LRKTHFLCALAQSLAKTLSQEVFFLKECLKSRKSLFHIVILSRWWSSKTKSVLRPSSEESLICQEDFKPEEGFFAPGVYPEPAEGVAQNDRAIVFRHFLRELYDLGEWKTGTMQT